MDVVGFITQEGLMVPTDLLKARFGDKFNQFLKKLTLTYYPKVGPPKSSKLYKFKNRGYTSYTYLPRTLAKLLLKNKILTRVEVALPLKREIARVPLCIDLFDNQRIVVNELLKVFTVERQADGTGCCILNLRAGLGKTYVAAGIISALGLRTLYVVPKVPLAEQAVDDLKTCFYTEDGAVKYMPIVIGQFHKKPKKKDWTTDPARQDVTVIVIDSAVLRDAEFFTGYSLVILDEVHTYCTEVRKKIFKMAGAWAMLGMSATTEDRKDTFDAIAHKELAFDGILRAENMPGFNYEGVDFKGLVTIIRYDGPKEFTQNLIHESTGKIFTPYMHKQFLRDPHRMILMINELRKLYDWIGPEGQRHCIYVFCEEVEPLEIVYRGFVDTFGEGNIAAPELGARADGAKVENAKGEKELAANTTGKFVGGIKAAKINHMRENARIFLTTYGYSGTGVSIDKMTAIVFLTPRRSNMKQIIPRVLRRGGDQSIQRRIIDLVDNRTMMKYQLGDRMNAYEYYGMEVETIKVKAPAMPDAE